MVRRKLGIELTGKGTIGYPLNLFFRAPGLLEQSGQKPATFFIPIDHGGAWANLRIIDPKRGIWRLMIDQAGDDVTPESVDREGYSAPRARPRDRRGMGRRQCLAPAQPGRRTLRRGPRSARRRCGTPIVADRRARHEFRRRRRGRSRLEARRRVSKAGAVRVWSKATMPNAGRSARATCAWRPASIRTTRPSRSGRRR